MFYKFGFLHLMKSVHKVLLAREAKTESPKPKVASKPLRLHKNVTDQQCIIAHKPNFS